MSDQALVIRELERAVEREESVVLASIVRTAGSAYLGVGTRMVVRADGSTAGLVSGGCLEADLVARAESVRQTECADLVTYDSHSEDDLVWGLGLGCDGMVQVLLEPLSCDGASQLAGVLRAAGECASVSVLATGISGDSAIGQRLLMYEAGTEIARIGEWSSEDQIKALLVAAPVAIGAGRRGATCEVVGAEFALEVIAPPLRLVICGSGPDVVPLAQLASMQGWNVVVIDHRPTAHAHAERFPSAVIATCLQPDLLRNDVRLDDRTAIVVMSHNYPRDLEYVNTALGSEASYVGVLGPQRRTERMLSELSARGEHIDDDTLERLHAPIGLDIGGDGPDAIALSIVAEVSAIANHRNGGLLRERRAPIHDAAEIQVRTA
jgi:xanthine dehydrogenase accessory factor